MADPLVAPSVVRFTIHGEVGGRPVNNVLDVVISGNAGVNRTEAIDEVAVNLLNQWTEVILDRTTSSYTAEFISWVDLDSEDGSVGSYNATDDWTWPKSGGLNGERASGNVAILVTKVTTASRGSRNGRMFLPPPSEDSTSANNLNTAYVESLQAGCSAFLENMTNTAIGAGYQTFPTVVHTRTTGTGANRVTEYLGNTQITDLFVNRLLATQRRRLRG